MKDKRFAFAGNRAFVLEKMFEYGLNVVKIWAVKDSYLQYYLEQKNIEYSVIGRNEQFISDIDVQEFDYFISNGMPVILPVERLQRHGARNFVNIHPSLLPELKGKDPVPGALLFQKDSGATCHLMDEEIDTGAVISQVKIENTPDLEAGLLYQLSFMAEADAFELAYRRGFVPLENEDEKGKEAGTYYSFRESDLEIDLKKESPEKIIAKVKAFSTKSKGAYFEYNGRKYRCSDAGIIVNQYLIEQMAERQNNSMVMTYEDKMVYKKDGVYIKFTATNTSEGYTLER